MEKRVFLIVIDSFGIGELPDADLYGDAGCNTLKAILKSPNFNVKNMARLGLTSIDGVKDLAGVEAEADSPIGAYARLGESSKGKDTTIGHWEIAGIVSAKPLPVFPTGFPPEIIKEFENRIGRECICNRAYSGAEVIKDYGDEHVRTKSLIVYTSADSVFQIAAHEDIIPKELLYEYCKIARDLLTGEYGVAWVIARPFIGQSGNYRRTPNRKDFSLEPPVDTLLDYLKRNNYQVVSIGKIEDIFAYKGITGSIATNNNEQGFSAILQVLDTDFSGLCFVNLIDFDMLYGHRNDIDGYAKALSAFDDFLPLIMEKLRDEDILMITADHGCDPSTRGTDHTREYVPLLIYGKHIAPVNLGTRSSFADIAATILEYLDVPGHTDGTGFLDIILLD